MISVKHSHNDPLRAALGKLVTPPPVMEVSAAWHALFDVKQTAAELVVLVDLPGVDEDEISIDIVGGSLEINVAREFDHDTEDAEEYTRIERPYGQFVCNVDVPPTADPDGMTARYRRGVLKVRIPLNAKC